MTAAYISNIFNIYILIGCLVIGLKYNQLITIQTQSVKKKHIEAYNKVDKNVRDLVIALAVLLYVIVWPLFIFDLSNLEDEDI